MQGIIFNTIAPLILVFGATAFVLFSYVFRYHVLFVITPYLETDGLLYLVVLQQLFVGVYVMELYMVGLFTLVRDNNNQFVCGG